jgi:hypothetical protein
MDLTADQMEEVHSARTLAERFAMREHTLAKLAMNNTSEVILAMERQRLSDLWKKVEEDPLAQMFVPQAQKKVAMEDARRRYFELETFLGRMEQGLFSYLAHTAGLPDMDADPPEDPSLDWSDEESLDRFLDTTIKTGDPRKILEHMFSLLYRARADMERRTDVPPLPAKYRLPAEAKLAFFVANVAKEAEE